MSDFGRIRIQHAGLHVKNLEETAQWYHDVLGFEIMEKRPDRPNGVMPRSWWLRNGDFYLELYEVLGARPFTFEDYEFTEGVKHLSFSIENLDALMDHIYAQGNIEVCVDNKYHEKMCGIPGGDRAVYLRDNNGFLVELQKNHDRV